MGEGGKGCEENAFEEDKLNKEEEDIFEHKAVFVNDEEKNGTTKDDHNEYRKNFFKRLLYDNIEKTKDRFSDETLLNKHTRVLSTG